MFVIAIRLYGADEVSDVVGPFDTWLQAHAWIGANRQETPDELDRDDIQAWYDIFELTKPKEE